MIPLQRGGVRRHHWRMMSKKQPENYSITLNYLLYFNKGVFSIGAEEVIQGCAPKLEHVARSVCLNQDQVANSCKGNTSCSTDWKSETSETSGRQRTVGPPRWRQRDSHLRRDSVERHRDSAIGVDEVFNWTVKKPATYMAGGSNINSERCVSRYRVLYHRPPFSSQESCELTVVTEYWSCIDSICPFGKESRATARSLPMSAKIYPRKSIMVGALRGKQG